MLQFKAKKVDVCKISKILVRYDVESEISSDTFTVLGDVSEKMISEILENVKVTYISNFESQKNTEFSDDSFSENVKNVEESKVIIQVPECVKQKVLVTEEVKEYDLIFDKVKRGEVYYCDFGKPYGSEQGGLRPAIIVQNDLGNSYSNTTIVLPLTSENKKELPTHYFFYFNDENVEKYAEGKKKLMLRNTTLGEQIKVVDKTRLREYICTMNLEFMSKIDEIIAISVDIDRTISRDINMAQIELLSLVNIDELIKVFNTSISSEEKVKEMLKLFGFNDIINGIDYLEKAILFAPKDEYYNLEKICGIIKRNVITDIDENEINRLIVSRVKSNFNSKFKKAPTIDFIRLLNIFLIK